MPPAPLTGFQWYAQSEWLARLQRKCSMELPRSRLKQEHESDFGRNGRAAMCTTIFFSWTRISSP